MLLVIVGWRTYRAIVPYGASFTPFVMARVKGPLIESPDGDAKLQVWFNDAGAAHSGNHWTWLVKDNPLFGKSVVAQGYTGAEQAVSGSGEPIPVDWIDNTSFSISFLSGRYTSAQEKRIVKLK